MTRTNTQAWNPDRRIFSSTIAAGFVRIVTVRRGAAEARTGEVFLDYLNRSKPAGNRGQRKAA
jgi:hypothetical protein